MSLYLYQAVWQPGPLNLLKLQQNIQEDQHLLNQADVRETQSNIINSSKFDKNEIIGLISLQPDEGWKHWMIDYE